MRDGFLVVDIIGKDGCEEIVFDVGLNAGSDSCAKVLLRNWVFM